MTCSSSAEHASALPQAFHCRRNNLTGACSCLRTKKAASTRLALVRIERGEEGLRVLLLLEHMRRDIAPSEGLAQLHAHKGARGKAGDGRVIVLEHVAVHVRVVVIGVFGDAETVIVDENADPLADLLASFLQ